MINASTEVRKPKYIFNAEELPLSQDEMQVDFTNETERDGDPDPDEPVAIPGTENAE